MDKVNAKLGTNYELFNYYGAPDADRVIVAMGSFCDVAEEVIDYLNATRREGRPGQGPPVPSVRRREASSSALPETVKKIAVLDRTKEPGSIGEPLYLDVVTALARGRQTDIHRRPAAATAWAPRTPRPRLRLRRLRGAREGRAASASSPSASSTT